MTSSLFFLQLRGCCSDIPSQSGRSVLFMVFLLAHRAFSPPGGWSVNRSPMLDTDDNSLRDESHGAPRESPRGHIISRCQRCKYISHRGLFIFVFQTQTSTHGGGDLLNKPPLRDWDVNSGDKHNCHGNVRCCHRTQTRTAALEKYRPDSDSGVVVCVLLSARLKPSKTRFLNSATAVHRWLI